MVRDLPTHGKRVGLYIDTRRFQCRACAKTFYEELPKIDEKRAMTAYFSDRDRLFQIQRDRQGSSI